MVIILKTSLNLLQIDIDIDVKLSKLFYSFPILLINDYNIQCNGYFFFKYLKIYCNKISTVIINI